MNFKEVAKRVGKVLYAIPLLILGLAVVGGEDMVVLIGEAEICFGASMFPTVFGYLLVFLGVWLVAGDDLMDIGKKFKVRERARHLLSREESDMDRILREEQSGEKRIL